MSNLRHNCKMDFTPVFLQ